MAEVDEGALEVLESYLVPGVAPGELGGVLNEPASLCFDQGLKNGGGFLIEIGDAHLLGDLVDKILVAKE